MGRASSGRKGVTNVTDSGGACVVHLCRRVRKVINLVPPTGRDRPNCPRCGSIKRQLKNGRSKESAQRYVCRPCGKCYTVKGEVNPKGLSSSSR